MSRSLAFSSPNPFALSSRSPRDLTEPFFFGMDHDLSTIWYNFHQSFGSTAIQKMQLRKEPDTPFHEFVVVLTQAGYIYRVDRGREGFVLGTLREQGVPPVDTIALLDIPSLEELDGTSYCAMELCWESNRMIDLALVLDICFQIHNNSGKRYKLLTHNCYFFAQTIVMITARKTATCKLDRVLTDMSRSDILLDVARNAGMAVIRRAVLELRQLYLGQLGMQQNLQMKQRLIGSWWKRLQKLGRKWDRERERKREHELEREREWEQELERELERELEYVWELELELEIRMELLKLEREWEREWERKRVMEREEREWKRDMYRRQERGEQSRELALKRMRVREWMRERAWGGRQWEGSVEELRNQLGIMLEEHLGLLLEEQLGKRLRGQLGKRVGKQLGKQLGKHLVEALEPQSMLRLMLHHDREQFQHLHKLGLLSQEALTEVLQMGLIGELNPDCTWPTKCNEVMAAAHASGHACKWAKWLVGNLGKIVIQELQHEPLLGCSFSWLLKFPASFSASSKLNAKAADVPIKKLKDLEDHMNRILAQHLESVPPALGSREELRAEILSGMTATWHLVSQFQHGVRSRAIESVPPTLRSGEEVRLRPLRVHIGVEHTIKYG